MPRTFIPFGQMAPDAGMFGNGNIMFAEDVVPIFGGYATAPCLLEVTSTDLLGASDVVMGFHSHINSSRSHRFFIASGDKLFMTAKNTATINSDVSRVGGYGTTLVGTDGYGGQFYSFGIYVIFTNGNDAVQYRSGDSDVAATLFATMINTTSVDGATLVQPRAQFVSSIKNHLVLANIDLTASNDTAGVAMGGAFDTLTAQRYPELVWWSATDNLTRFGSEGLTPSLIGTGYQTLYDDYGHITGLSGGEDLYIFKERAIYRMSGPPFTFELLSGEVGTTFPNSIVRLGNDVYFWSYSGPYVISGGQVKSLSDSKIDMWLNGMGEGLSLLNGNRGRMDFRFVQGGVSQINDCIIWNISEQTPDDAAPYDERIANKYCITYNINSQSFAVNELKWGIKAGAVPAIGDYQIYGPRGITAELGLDTRIGSVLTFPDVVFFWKWAFGSAQDGLFLTTTGPASGFAGGFNRVESTVPKFLTGYVQIDQGASTIIRRVRPVFTTTKVAGAGGTYPDGMRPSVKIVVKSRNVPHGPIQETPEFTALTGHTSQDDNGWVSITDAVAADFHTFYLEMPGDELATKLFNGYVMKYHGLEVEYDTVGVRSRPYA